MTVGASPRSVTFTSDYGTGDEFVGVCHAVIARIAPAARVIDLAHAVTGVRAGAAALAQSVAYAPPDAVHLAVVDPEVGTDRRGVAIATSMGALLVGPDNGLLLDAAAMLGGPGSVREIVNPRYRLEPVSATFHGRDVFAPAAAHLALGVDLVQLGPLVDPASLTGLPLLRVLAVTGSLEADVLRADGFGNLQLAASDADLEQTRLRGRILVQCSDRTVPGIVGRTFADAPPRGLVVYVDSAGHVGVAVRGASAKGLLASPASVRITPAH